MKIIVGLGNPGSNYERTRHNVGFSLLDQLAEEMGATFSFQKRYNAEVAQGSRSGHNCILLKPMTYMNLSGDSVSKFLNFYKSTVKDMVVIYDDIDLLEGKVKLKDKGGHGGHNGMRSLISRLGSSDFALVKVGVGRPEAKDDNRGAAVTDWLLKPVKSEVFDEFISSVYKCTLDRLDIFLQK